MKNIYLIDVSMPVTCHAKIQNIVIAWIWSIQRAQELKAWSPADAANHGDNGGSDLINGLIH
jgi:hypothetical protein